MSTRHTVVLSDVHLAEADPGDGPWLRYRQRRWFPDDDFRTLVDRCLGIVKSGDELDLVFGGDLIEFEGPRVVDGETRFDDRPRTEDDAVETLSRVVRDHDLFFRAISDVARAGHRVVFVIGNHDVQLTFPRVQSALRAHIQSRVPEADAARIHDRICIRPWFFQTDDGIHVEHGHQYDTYCSFRDPLRPMSPETTEIQPTMGSLAFRHLISRMGYFNAHDERSYMLSAPRYLWHWVRHYLFTRRSLASTWFFGAFRIAWVVMTSRPARRIARAMHEQAQLTRSSFARALGVSEEKIHRHAEMFAPPADTDPHRVMRELRLDGVALAAVGIAGIVTSIFKPKLGLAMTLGAIGAGIAQAIIRPHRSTDAEYDRAAGVARRVAKLYQARAVVFGHTHIPGAEVDDGVLYANTGSWTPAAPGIDDEEMLDDATPKGRPVVWLRRPKGDPKAPIEGGLYRFKAGVLLPAAAEEERTSPEPAIAGTLVEG